MIHTSLVAFLLGRGTRLQVHLTGFRPLREIRAVLRSALNLVLGGISTNATLVPPSGNLTVYMHNPTGREDERRDTLLFQSRHSD